MKYRRKLIFKIKDELGKKYILNIWNEFSHRGDGIHPNRKTVEHASKRVGNNLLGYSSGFFGLVEFQDIIKSNI
jgi:hypothetical protein